MNSTNNTSTTEPIDYAPSLTSTRPAQEEQELSVSSVGTEFVPYTFKHYQLRKPLGEGGFGLVFEAWDNKLMRAVAIKQVKNLGSVQTTQNLLQEARMAASLKVEFAPMSVWRKTHQRPRKKLS